MYSLILHGKRLVLSQKCRHLRFVVQNGSSLFNSYSATASGVSVKDGRKGKNFTVSYLVDSLGLAKKLAESISKKVSFENKGNPDSVLNLLRSYGFTDSQISSIITDYPKLLILDAEKSLAPKLQFLQSIGASSSELTEIVSTVPEILGKKEGKSISRSYDFVKEVLEADKSSKLEKLCHSLPQGSKQENKIRNILVLRELGVPQKLLFSLLVSDSRPVSGKESFEESLKKVVEMGFDPTTSKFVTALCIIKGFRDKTIEEKVNVYISLGFAVEDVWAMFKSFPPCIGYSAESVKKKIEFLVKKMNWPLKALVSIPQVLGYSLEKRIVPRCNVIRVLMLKGLLVSEVPPMSSVLTSPGQVFLNRFVMKHDDKQLVRELMAIFTKNRVSLTHQLEQ